jgi:hypothetical protein
MQEHIGTEVQETQQSVTPELIGAMIEQQLAKFRSDKLDVVVPRELQTRVLYYSGDDGGPKIFLYTAKDLPRVGFSQEPFLCPSGRSSWPHWFKGGQPFHVPVMWECIMRGACDISNGRVVKSSQRKIEAEEFVYGALAWAGGGDSPMGLVRLKGDTPTQQEHDMSYQMYRSFWRAQVQQHNRLARDPAFTGQASPLLVTIAHEEGFELADRPHEVEPFNCIVCREVINKGSLKCVKCGTWLDPRTGIPLAGGEAEGIKLAQEMAKTGRLNGQFSPPSMDVKLPPKSPGPYIPIVEVATGQIEITPPVYEQVERVGRMRID